MTFLAYSVDLNPVSENTIIPHNVPCLLTEQSHWQILQSKIKLSV